MKLRNTVLLVFVLATACGQQDPGMSSLMGDAAVSAPTGKLLPWKVGNRWTYRVTDEDGITMKVTTIGPAEPVGGSGPNKDIMANKVVTKKGLMDQTISWQADMGTRVVRYREQAFHAGDGTLEMEEHWSPPKLHIDDSPEHTIKGASWLELYQETKLPVGADASTTTARDRWTIMSESETVTVPAGTFQAVVIGKAGGSAAKTYWYVRGIGKVKEVGGQTEELVSFEVMP